MSTIATDTSVVHEGWNVLVEQLGLRKATEFVIQLERGQGDSIKEIADYWGDASLDDIQNRIKQWKSERR